jgi:hypothetical protein
MIAPRSMKRPLLSLLPGGARRRVSACAALVVTCLGGGIDAAPRGQESQPDFTKGEPIPEGATHDWTLGATGARGWMYSERLETSSARQIRITAVADGSPASGTLKVDDVILGVHSRPFARDPRVEFGTALTVAESEAGAGKLRLTRWREGKTEEVTIELPVLGSYGATAPYDCPKSLRILRGGCEALAARMREPDYPRSQNAVTRSLNALALLASGDPGYLPLIEREARWAADFSSRDFQTWWYGYVISLLAEYQMATGDDSLMPGMRRLALEAAEGQSIVGSWGHKFAGPGGRLGGYGMMNAPGLPLTTSLILARMAGLSEPEIDLAIERSARLLSFYIGKGAVPYGDHDPWTETHEDNGKCGMAAVLFHLLREKEGAAFFSRMSLASHGPERDTGHTGNFWNMTWAIPGVALSGPEATGAWMREFGAWYFDLARGADGSFRHQGPPEARPDSTGGWDATGAYLLAYAMPLRNIHLTGRTGSVAPQLDAATVAATIRDGRGWSNNNRHGAYDSLAPEELLERLASWSPVVRERAAMAIARRGGEKPVDALVEMLGSPSPEVRLGACEALRRIGGASAPAVAALLAQLDHEDLWLRVKAADALAHIGPPAMEALPELLERLAVGATDADPRGMEQRYLCFAVFGRMLRNTLEGVDRDRLTQAVVAGLQNQDGRARSEIGTIYRLFPYEEIRPLLPAIYRAVVEPAPSGIMFADGIRLKGLEILAAHRVAEGMDACVDYLRNQNRWASEKRTPEVLTILTGYGAHARSVVPKLKEIADEFGGGEPDFPRRLSEQKAAAVREAIASIEASEERPELTRLP